MTLQVGEKIHIIERRYFKEDLRRHFVGEITQVGQSTFRCLGYVWIFDSSKTTFVRKDQKRERVFLPTDRTVINIIPSEVDLEKIIYVNQLEKGMVVSDQENFILDINEFTFDR